MMGEEKTDLSKLCLHTITTKPWSIEEDVKNYASAGIKGITVWRNALEGRNIRSTGKIIRDEGLTIVSLCRGGFFAHKDLGKRKDAIDDNKIAIEEASELGSDLIVLVPGADPSQSLEDSRKQIKDGIEALLPLTSSHGIRLAIEPLHPMYADTRSAINTLKQANDLAEMLNSKWVGVAVDIYHLWWDSELHFEIQRCGKAGNLFAFHICDWKSPTLDLLNDRGLMGTGCIPIKEIKSWVEEAGFSGFNEVEIFSNEYWKMDQAVFLRNIVEAYKKHV